MKKVFDHSCFVSSWAYTILFQAFPRAGYFFKCPNRYKAGVIQNFIHRAYAICSDYKSQSTDTSRIQELLSNNNYPNCAVDRTINKIHFIEN